MKKQILKLLKKRLGLVLAAIIGFNCWISSGYYVRAVNDEDISDAYLEIVEKSLMKEYVYTSVAYFYLPGSKIDFLAVGERIASDTSYCRIYHYTKGKAKKLVTENISGGGMKKYKNYLMFSWGHEASYCGAAIYKYKNNKLKKVVRIEAYVSGYSKAGKFEKKACKKAKLKYANFKWVKFHAEK